MSRAELGFAPREVAPGIYQFQRMMSFAARNGQQMIKTLDPHARLPDEQEAQDLGYAPEQMIARTRAQRVRLPHTESTWRRSLMERAQKGQGGVIYWETYGREEEWDGNGCHEKRCYLQLPVWYL